LKDWLQIPEGGKEDVDKLRLVSDYAKYLLCCKGRKGKLLPQKTSTPHRMRVDEKQTREKSERGIGIRGEKGGRQGRGGGVYHGQKRN